MVPDKATMMMLLFVSSENPLWKHLIFRAKKEVIIPKYIGISRTTISNWRKGGKLGVRPGGVPLDESIFSKLEERLKGGALDKKNGYAKLTDDIKISVSSTITKFKSIYENRDSRSVYDAAHTLGIDLTTCQIILDNAIYSAYPLFPELFYDSSRRDQLSKELDFEKYKGLYFLYVRRIHEGTLMWLRCPLRVRYVLKIGDGHAIRCKLNFPILRKTDFRENYWEYDGFLSVKPPALFWNFEKRKSQDRMDYFYFVTSTGEQPPGGGDVDALTASGAYLTTGQDRPRSIINGDVILRRQEQNPNSDQEIKYFMHNSWEIVHSPSDCAVLDGELKAIKFL